MKKNVRIELYKALHSKALALSLLIGLAIVFMNVAASAKDVKDITERILSDREKGLLINGNTSCISLFVLTIAYDCWHFASFYFMHIWPVLAALPFGWSYLQERRSGLYNQIVSRSSVKTYFFSKYIAVFVSGGLAVAGTVALDILLNALVCPYYVLSPTDRLSFTSNYSFLPGLFYTYPWLHAAVWCVVLFLLGGATAGLCFVVGAKPRLQVLVILTPFVLLYLWEVAFFRIGPKLGHLYYLWTPLELVYASISFANPAWVVFSIIAILTGAGLGLGYWQVVKHELV